MTEAEIQRGRECLIACASMLTAKMASLSQRGLRELRAAIREARNVRMSRAEAHLQLLLEELLADEWKLRAHRRRRKS